MGNGVLSWLPVLEGMGRLNGGRILLRIQRGCHLYWDFTTKSSKVN